MKQRDIHILVSSDPRLLRAVRGLVRGYVENLGLTADQTDEVVLAVDEACANSIRHSYEGKTDAELELTLRAEPTFIEVDLRDEGVPVPEERTRRRELTQPDIATLKPGGLGLQFIHQVFDEVQFRPGRERGNRLTMRLRRPFASETERKRSFGHSK